MLSAYHKTLSEHVSFLVLNLNSGATTADSRLTLRIHWYGKLNWRFKLLEKGICSHRITINISSIKYLINKMTLMYVNTKMTSNIQKFLSLTWRVYFFMSSDRLLNTDLTQNKVDRQTDAASRSRRKLHLIFRNVLTKASVLRSATHLLLLLHKHVPTFIYTVKILFSYFV